MEKMSSSSEETDYNIKTDVINEKITIGWEIINIERFLHLGKSLKSEKICTDETTSHEWQLVLNIEENECISFLAISTSDEVTGHMFSITCSILNSQYQKVYTRQIGYLRNVMETCKEYGHPNFTTKADLESQAEVYTTDNTLKLLIEIEFAIYISQKKLYLTINKLPSAAKNSNNFQKLFENRLFSDVLISVGKKSFPAHKAILSAKSPIFFEIFATDPQMKVYETSDWSILVMKKIVEWIYTGALKEELYFIDDNLLAAAHAFNLWDLKLLTEVKLSKTFSPETAILLLTCAQNCDATFLKSRAIRYITKNAKKFVEREDFQNLLVKNPHFISEIFQNS